MSLEQLRGIKKHWAGLGTHSFLIIASAAVAAYIKEFTRKVIRVGAVVARSGRDAIHTGDGPEKEKLIGETPSACRSRSRRMRRRSGA